MSKKQTSDMLIQNPLFVQKVYFRLPGYPDPIGAIFLVDGSILVSRKSSKAVYKKSPKLFEQMSALVEKMREKWDFDITQHSSAIQLHNFPRIYLDQKPKNNVGLIQFGDQTWVQYRTKGKIQIEPIENIYPKMKRKTLYREISRDVQENDKRDLQIISDSIEQAKKNIQGAEARNNIANIDITSTYTRDDAKRDQQKQQKAPLAHYDAKKSSLDNNSKKNPSPASKSSERISDTFRKKRN